MNYFHKSDLVKKIQLEALEGIELDNLTEEMFMSIKKRLFENFQSKAFQAWYKDLAIEIATNVYGSPIGSCLQTSPTPRIFFPDAHGTSVHYDYWYGHGEKTITIWVPLLNVVSGATFLADTKEEIMMEDISDNLETTKITDLEEQLELIGEEILPSEDYVYVFSSQILHGSIHNTTRLTRLSFDFRISQIDDITCTKDLPNYLQYSRERGSYVEVDHTLYGKRLLKYIVGGKFKNTFAQHIVIDSFANRYNLTITEQEAEVERANYPILRSLSSKSYNLSSEHDAIIVASISLLGSNIVKELRFSKIEIWLALENCSLKDYYADN